MTRRVVSVEPRAANRLDDEDHSTFWLVVADQFAKLGIVSERARAKALQIIDDGSDIAMLTKLGIDASGLKKRQKMLVDLRRSLLMAAPPGTRASTSSSPSRGSRATNLMALRRSIAKSLE